MKELEEVNCEIRRIVNLQFPVLGWSRNSEGEEHGQISQEQDSDSEYRGGFLHNATYAWLSYGCHLVVFNAKIGENISSWTFRGVVTSVSPFPAQSGEFPLLLVGVDNCANKLKDSSGLLCIFDCTTSRVLRAIRMSCGVEQVCVVSGGAEWEEFNDKRLDNILNEMDGIACVVLRNLQHIMIDLLRRSWDVYDLSSVMDENSPAELDFLSANQIVGRHQSNREKHAAYNLLNRRIEKHIGFNREDFESSPLLGESLTTAITSSIKIGCLISGCLGRVIIWQNDGSIRWVSPPVDENMAVTHLALLEPTDDPRPFYYLWVVFQDELSRTPPVLRMYAMLFERKYYDQDVNLYFNLEDEPSLKFESELNEGDRIVGLCTVERESNSEQTDSSTRRGEDNLLLIATNERTLLFDLNQWYKEQMPRTIGECQNPNSILATYRTRVDSDSQVVNFAYVPLSLREFPTSGHPNSPEELFYPNSLSLEWVELSPRRLTFWMTRGVQAELLREMALAGPIILLQPSETFHRCLAVGLVPFNSTEFTFASDQNAQREMLLSLCLEQRWSTFLVRCVVEWADGSASYLYPTFLKWGIQRASTIKMIADRLCVPLFDQSGSSIGEADVKNLRFCSQQLECLSSVVGKLPSVAVADLKKQRRTLKRVSTYFQVLLWFYDVGLLPETQDLEEEEEENTLPISLALRVPYPYERLSALYREKRAQFQKDNNETNEQDLFIDELITRECPMLKAQWEREGGAATSGCYPPPSLQSLLRSYLTDYHQPETSEISCKHQITIYLLMDLQAMLLQRLYPAVKQLIKYPSAFKMTPSLIKLTQAFWLLDHEDYQEFLDTITGQLIADSDVKDWHHRLILRTLLRNNQHKLALVYLRVRKPPLSSLEEQSVAVSLSVEHGLVQSAFHRRPPCHYEQLLVCFFRACKKYGKLDEILHLALDTEEEEVFIRFLEESQMEDLRLLYYLQRCRYTEAIGNHPIRQFQSTFTRDIQSTSFNMLDAYSMTLPEVTKQFSLNGLVGNGSDVDLKARYSRPMSHRKSHDRLRNIYETVIAKARETYLRNEKYQIPFVSVPSMSLKFNSCGTNMNCVSFPSLVPKSQTGKRRIDQVYQEQEADRLEDAKRRRLSDSLNKSDSRESGLTAAFETPLVERKFNVCANKDTVPDTPHSILKIRQLVRSSTSSSTETIQGEEVANGLSEKKINRQIRFNINQSSKKTLTYEEEKDDEEEEEDEEKEEEEAGDERTNSRTNNDVCPPNRSYYESAILSDNSSITSSKIYGYARPRPSLRRSALSVESLQESCAKNLSTTFSPINAIDSTLKRCNSSQSAFVYSTTMLSSDTSVDVSYPRTSELVSPLDWRRDKYTISSTPLVKSIASSRFVKRSMEVDQNEDLKLGSTDHDRSDLEEQQNNLEQDLSQKKTEGRYNNGNIAREESPVLQNPCEDSIFFEKVAEPNLVVLDESEDELLQLRDDEEETFESLPTNPEDNLQTQLEGPYSIAKSNGLRESVADVDFTDDESVVSGRSVTPMVPERTDQDDKKEHSSERITHPEEIFYDMSNITDDESDSNTREAEELKTKNGGFSNSSGYYVTQSSEVEWNQSESAEKKPDERESQSKEAVAKIISEADDKDTNVPTNLVDKTECEEKPLETETSLKSMQSFMESENLPYVRLVRSARADSMVRDKMSESLSTPEKIARPRRRNSTKSLSGSTEEAPVLHRMTSTSDFLLAPLSQGSDNEKAPQLRRASSITTEESGSPRPILRSRRGTSLAKDTLMSSLEETVATKSESFDASVKRDLRPTLARSKRTLLRTKDSDSESVKDGAPVRRNARRLSSSKKEEDAAKLMSDDEEDRKSKETKKRSLRVRKSSASSDTGRTTISMSSSSRLDKKAAPEEELKMTRTSRRRGCSVPKEIPMQIGRRSRSSSLIKEIIPEVPEPESESRTLRSSVNVGRPTRNTRNRSASIQSIPEELEEILSPPMRRTRSARKEEEAARAADVRQRRASSADMTHRDVKRRARGIRGRSIAVEPIVEEPAESEDRGGSLEGEQAESENPVASKKRTSTMVKENAQKQVKKRGRPRKIDANKDSSNLFTFSQPEKADDVPFDEKEIGKIPNYVFSPPQTKSKSISPNQHQK